VRGVKGFGRFGVVLGQKLVVETVDLIALPHLPVLSRAQPMRIITLELLLMNLRLTALIVIRQRLPFLSLARLILPHKRYLDTGRNRHRPRSEFRLYQLLS
jgi:hypothetical protein